MAFFNFLRKRSGQTEKAGLNLELLLQKAATDSTYRAQFYKRLLSDNLVIITENTDLPDGDQTLVENTSVNIVSFPDGKIPVFTSTERIFDKGVIKKEIHILQLKGEDVFNLAKGATFLLNPYSDYGKELLPDEIESLLNGTILTDGHKKIEIKKETPVQIGQPAVYPNEIVEVLKEIFSGTNVNAAYLGWIFTPSSGEPPHYIFGIKGSGDLQNTIQKAGLTAQKLLKHGEFVDFVIVDNKGGVSDYFLKETTPFYVKEAE